jgi:MoxR-like ATPase
LPSLVRIVDPFGLLPAASRLGVRTLEWALATRTAVDVVDVVARSPAARRAAQAALERFDDAAAPLVDRALASADVWRLVDEVAQSPALAEAVARQGAGFADQVADEVGDRTRRADARLERAARRMLRRSPQAGHGPGSFAPPQAP